MSKERPDVVVGLGRSLVRIALALVVVGVVAFVSRGWIERRTFYLPDRSASVVPAGVEDVRFRTEDGLELHGWWIPPVGGASAERPVAAVVHAHGNAGNVESHAGFSWFLRDHGFGLFVFDYRGYGVSDGDRSDLRRDRLVADTVAAVRYVRSREDVAAGRVGLMGQSLGVSFASHAAAELGDVPAVALVSGFSSWRGVASDHAGVLGRLLIGRGVDAEEAVARLGATQMLVVHGSADRIVPPRHAELLMDAARAAGVDAELVLVDGARHNDAPETHDEIVRGMVGFFARHLSGELGGGE